MPIYEYRREDGTTFEVMQKMTEDPLTTDPETGQPVTRVFHPVAVHFKGKGFYNTDYGKRKSGPVKDESSTSGDSSSASKTESKTESSSDKAPAKTESKSAPSGD